MPIFAPTFCSINDQVSFLPAFTFYFPTGPQSVTPRQQTLFYSNACYLILRFKAISCCLSNLISAFITRRSLIMDNDPDNLKMLLRLVRPDLPGGWVNPGRFKVWSPPEDPDRPGLPYAPGFTAEIEPHEAPPPFGDDAALYGPSPRRPLSDIDLNTITQSALVVSHPPLETGSVTTTAAGAGPTPEGQAQTAQMTITTPIRIGCENDAQVVICTIKQAGKEPFRAVAKIFDALYYRFRRAIAPAPRDVTAQADMDYTTEAAAYKRLAEAGGTGVAAPRYYGSWTLRLPITSRGVWQLRPVRLLLIERLDGVDLKSLRIQNNPMHDSPDAFHLPEDYRLEVMAQVLDSYVRMLHWGVEHNDLAPRNVILVTASDATRAARPLMTTTTGMTVPRAVLVDFNVAIVHGRTIKGKHPHEDLARPVNPMEWFWISALDDEFQGWVPREWTDTLRPLQEWLMRRFGTEEQRALYQPVTKKLEFATY